MKIRVVPHSTEGRWFVIEYNTGGFFGGKWRHINTSYTSSGIAHAHCKLPLMFRSFDEAVKQAEQFTSLDAIRIFEAKEHALFEEYVNRERQRLSRVMSQTWEKEIS